MKRTMLHCLLVLVLSFACGASGNLTNRYDTVTTTDGITYDEVVLMRKEGNSIIFFHSTGVGRVEAHYLPDNVIGDIYLPAHVDGALKEEQVKLLRSQVKAQYEATQKRLEQEKRKRLAEGRPKARQDAKKAKVKDAQLVLMSWRWSEEYGYVTGEGQVANISGKKLVNVKAVVQFYQQDGTFITSDNSFIEYETLMPGQVSPFKVYTKYNPRMQTASVQFKIMWGSQLNTVTKEEYDAAN